VSGTSGGGAARKRCTVAFATRERQYLWSVELPADPRERRRERVQRERRSKRGPR